MTTIRNFDVIVVGGGIAGSALAGVLARAGLGVLVVEREARFRDRIRGEATWPYGVADARHTGLGDLLRTASVELHAMHRYENRRRVSTHVWSSASVDGAPAIGFSHPGLQEAAFTWAASHGATMLRPAKGTTFTRSGRASVTIVHDGHQAEYNARLVVGADGKLSGVRRWVDGETIADPEHHRMGGVQVSGVVMDPESDNLCSTPTVAVNWISAGPLRTRLYLMMPMRQLKTAGVDRSFDQLIAFAAAYMPEGALENMRQEGPIGFFPNNCIWSSQIAGNSVVLIGDAAGAPDPSQGHGTALVFRDVRILSELLLSERDWESAIEEFARQRRDYYDVVLQYDRWRCLLREEGDEADRRRERHKRAKAEDPTLGGFNLIEARGPDGLVADDAARRRFFGEG